MTEQDKINANTSEHDDTLSSLYAKSKTGMPPASLDDAILAAARRQVKSAPRAMKSGYRRWAVPMSVAATLVLSLTVVLNIDIEQTEMKGYAPMPDASMMPEKKAEAPLARSEMEFQQNFAEPASRARNAVQLQQTPVDAVAKAKRQLNKPLHEIQMEADMAPAPEPTMVVSETAEPGLLAEDVAESEQKIKPDEVMGATASASMASVMEQEQWLINIESLLKNNKQPEAVKQLKAFGKKYPDYDLEKLEQRFGKELIEKIN